MAKKFDINSYIGNMSGGAQLNGQGGGPPCPPGPVPISNHESAELAEAREVFYRMAGSEVQWREGGEVRDLAASIPDLWPQCGDSVSGGSGNSSNGVYSAHLHPARPVLINFCPFLLPTIGVMLSGGSG